ncbi:MAG: NarK/NasA family nitrate transporter [Planctomycetes bacterium]|nr:NarK/NasA family nitrate transporter [Planctomycetota bacterium]
MNTLAFTICFAVWTMNGVLVTHLVTTGVFDWSALQIGVLMATPVLTGSLLRLPVGLLTDRYGGRPVYFVLMLLAALALVYNSRVDDFAGFFLAALGFGLSGASFAVGIVYTSVWFSKQRQGTALGVFGAGNAGSAITLLAAPSLLKGLTDGGADPEGWRTLPLIYAAALGATAVLFWYFTYPRMTPHGAEKTLRQRLSPLGSVRVWRFGAYYFLVFGAFVALSQWLVPYYVRFYEFPLAAAGVLAAIFSLPSGLIRALGGWLSDKFGARRIMYWVLGTCVAGCFLLIFPRMDVVSPGDGLSASADGRIESISDTQMVVRSALTGRATTYTIEATSQERPSALATASSDLHNLRVLPERVSWKQWGQKIEIGTDGSETRRPFQVGDTVKKKELLARGRTQISFQANVYVFTLIVFVVGIAMGIGKAAVYKHIPDYFPEEVGVVGGLVGVIGGLGGFVCPILFGQLLDMTGLWTSCWMFLFLVSAGCLWWMHRVVERMLREKMPGLVQRIDRHDAPVSDEVLAS